MAGASSVLESLVEGQVCAYAESVGWTVRKIAFLGRRGAPDRLFIRGPRTELVEFKRPGGKLRPDQEREVERLRAAGAVVHVIDDIAAGKHLFA